MNDVAARALSLFDDYVDLPAAERELKLLELATRDPALYTALRALLDADASDDSLLDRSPADLLASKQAGPGEAQAEYEEGADTRIGTRLGAWRIERVIERGGMGTVYEAHRDDGEYQQRVALKCIRTELATPQLMAAFRAERDLLARLDHPGIAGLVDGGVGEDGQPWFAMRLVEGIALDAWCDRRRLGIRERVGLLIQACDALGYAHAQGIVHRDIKPSNLLVTGEARVQLVDFGISSSVLARDLESREPIAVTPDYAAPEARDAGGTGLHGPAIDIYALGVLMYRLLCAQWPAPLHSLRYLIPIAGSGEPVSMERLLDHDRPGHDRPGYDRPDHDRLDQGGLDQASLDEGMSDQHGLDQSANSDGAYAGGADFIARQRGAANASALRRELAGDLSAIALKAAATRPQDRYASVNEFAGDLRRWCEHRPISIRPGNVGSRLRKWRRRNPVAAAMVGALVLAILAGLGLSLWQQRQTAREASATRAVTRLFASTLGTATLSGLGSTPFSSKSLLDKTERELARLPLSDQPALRARSLATLARSYATLGDYRHAEALASQAQLTLGDQADMDGFVAATGLSMLNNRARYSEAMRLARAKIALLEGRNEDSANTSRLILGTELAQAQWGSGLTRDAVATANHLVTQAAALGPGHEELHAQTLIQRANFLYRLAQPIPAEADARRAIAIARPINPILADDALEKLVLIVQLQPNLEARALAKELLRRRTDSLGPTHPKTAYATIRLSVFPDSGLSRHDVAQALASIRTAYGTDNPQYASAMSSAAWAIARDRQDTLAHLRAAIRVLDSHLPANNELRLSARHNLGLMLLFTHDGPVAPTDIQEGLAVLRQTISAERKAGLPAIPESELMVAYLADSGRNADLPELERLLGELRNEIITLFGPDNYRLRSVDFFHGKLLFRQGRHEQADREFARLLHAERDFIASGGTGRKALVDFQSRSVDLIWALLYRSLHALETCRTTQAVDYLEQAVKLSETAPLSPPEVDRIVQAYLAGARKAQLPDLAPQVVPTLDREQVNRAARQCQQRPRHGQQGSPTAVQAEPPGLGPAIRGKARAGFAIRGKPQAGLSFAASRE